MIQNHGEQDPTSLKKTVVLLTVLTLLTLTNLFPYRIPKT